MLAVIGVDICLGDVNGIDAFDYHLYHNKLINLTPSLNQTSGDTVHNTLSVAQQLIDNLLTVNHLLRSDALLILVDALNKPFTKMVIDQLSVNFKSHCVSFSVADALLQAETISDENKAAVVIISLSQYEEMAISGLLVCSSRLLNDHRKQFSLSHCYAEIEAVSSIKLVEHNQSVHEHIKQFFTDEKFNMTDVESILTQQLGNSISRSQHHHDWLTAYRHSNTIKPASQVAIDKLSEHKTTLLTNIECVAPNIEQSADLMGLVASVLCLDQAYRLGSKQALVQAADDTEQIKMWEGSPFYCLSASTSYLYHQGATRRRLLLSQCNHNSHQLILLTKSIQTSGVTNGLLAQHSSKPFVYKAENIEDLLGLLMQSEVNIDDRVRDHIPFKAYCVEQYESSEDQINSSTFGYCVVLIADSFVALKQQIKLALTGVATSIATNNPWKTPAGSYFSGQRVEFTDKQKPVTFLYPGVGALYLNMGKDLLRLFPASYQTLSELSNDLVISLQDKLLTPRLVSDVHSEQKKHLDSLLRHNLTNIAEAGVSYACLLTAILQQQLNIKASTAAGYSMGEVSMFAALGCWQAPSVLSERLRSSDTFTEQLTGPLKRLKTAWHEEDSDKILQWESYHLKAGVMQVNSIIDQFPRVYLTIINTSESLVIAGDPAQCLQLAKQLKVHAIALDVHNIIHCELAKSEYENMQTLYSLPIKDKLLCQLFSSSCYLPVPITEKAIAVSISKCLTELVDFPRLINNIYDSGESVFVEVGAGKSLSTWVERILKNSDYPVTCLAVNQKNLDDYSAILKAIAALISLGYRINLQDFFNGSLIRTIKKMPAPVLVS